ASPFAGAKERVVELLVRGGTALPAEVRLCPASGALGEATSARGVEQERRDRVGHLVRVLSDEQLLAGKLLDSLRRTRRRDERLSGSERLEHLHTHAAADADRRDHDGGTVEVWSHVGDG